MRDTKNVFTFGLFIVILLALAFVFLNQPGSAPQARLAQEPGLTAPETPQASTLEELKEQEILGLAPRQTPTAAPAADLQSAPVLRPTPRVEYPSGRSSLKNAPRYEPGMRRAVYGAGNTGHLAAQGLLFAAVFFTAHI